MLGVLVVVVVLVAAAGGAEVWARNRVEQLVADGLAQPGSEVTVHGFPVLLQLARGRLDAVTVAVPAVELDGLRFEELNGRAEGVSTRQPATARTLTVSALLPTAQIRAQLVPTLGEQVQVATEGGLLRVGIELRGFQLDAGFSVSVDGPGLALTPLDVRLGGVTMAVSDLPFGLGERIGPISVPVALPAGLTLADVAIVPEGARVTVTGRDVVLDESMLAPVEG